MKLRVLLTPVVMLASVVVPIATASQVLSESPAAAAGTCTSNATQHEFSGAYAGFPSDQTVGAAAAIVARPAGLCYGTSNATNQYSSTWEMLAGNYGSNTWVQGGNAVCLGQGSTQCTGLQTVLYSEQNDGVAGNSCSGTCKTWFGPTVSDGENSYFVTQYYQGSGFSGTCASTGCEVEVVCPNLGGCYVSMYTLYSPVFGGTGYSAWAQPFNLEFEGETDDPASDIPGSNDQGWSTFSELQYQEVNGTYNPPFNGIWGNPGGFPYLGEPTATWNRGGYDALGYTASPGRGWAFDVYCTNGTGPACY